MASSLEDLLERLTGTPTTSPAKTFAGRRPASKGGRDTIGSWIEGRLTKFIAGEEDEKQAAKAPRAAPKGSTAAPVGPFSHFSTISPAMSDAASRNGSTLDVASLNGHLGVLGDSRRTSPFMQQSPFSQSSPLVQVQAFDGTDPASDSPYAQYQPAQASPSYSWGGDREEDGNGDTPQAYEGGADHESDFINPMAALSLGQSAPGPSYDPPGSRTDHEEDDDDLGFGNKALSRARTPMPPTSTGSDESSQPNAKASAKPDTTVDSSPSKGDAQKAGWLRGWWGKKEGGETVGPIKAKLGDENKMVFDETTKRWIVKGVCDEILFPGTVLTVFRQRQKQPLRPPKRLRRELRQHRPHARSDPTRTTGR